MSRGEVRLTSLLKRIRKARWHSRPIDREHNPGGETEIVRRQFGAGGTPAGSGRALRLDPHTLPVRFDARDARADGGIRQVEIDRDRITLRRAVRGMRMAINVRVDDFLGIAMREADAGWMLVLVHRDPSLSIPLVSCEDSVEIEHAAATWRDTLALPMIDEDDAQRAGPASRRRRHNVIKTRRPRILMRRRCGAALGAMRIHRDEREIIAPE